MRLSTILPIFLFDFGVQLDGKMNNGILHPIIVWCSQLSKALVAGDVTTAHNGNWVTL